MRAKRVGFQGGSISTSRRAKAPGAGQHGRALPGRPLAGFVLAAAFVAILLIGVAAPVSGHADDVLKRAGLGDGEEDPEEEGPIRDANDLRRRMFGPEDEESDEERREGEEGEEEAGDAVPDRESTQNLSDGQTSERGADEGSGGGPLDNGSDGVHEEGNISPKQCQVPFQGVSCAPEPRDDGPVGRHDQQPSRDGKTEAAGDKERMRTATAYGAGEDDDATGSGWEKASGPGLVALLAWTLFVASSGTYGRSARAERNEEALSRLDPASRLRAREADARARTPARRASDRS